MKINAGSNRNKGLKLLNTLGFIIVLVMNTLAQAIPLGDRRPVSSRTNTPSCSLRLDMYSPYGA